MSCFIGISTFLTDSHTDVSLAENLHIDSNCFQIKVIGYYRVRADPNSNRDVQNYIFSYASE